MIQNLVFLSGSIPILSPLCIAPIFWIGGCFDRAQSLAPTLRNPQILEYDRYRMKGLLLIWMGFLLAVSSGAWGNELDSDRDERLVERFFHYFIEYQGTAKPLSEEEFEETKHSFLNSLGSALDEKALVEELTWDMASSLIPLSTQPFYQLRLTQDDQHHIYEMIKNLGELGWFGLLKKKKEMEKLGDKVYPVHPLRFMGYILSHPSLKKFLPKIMGDFVKRKSFFGGYGKRIGFSQRMTNEVNQGNMERYIPGFAQQVGVTEGSLRIYFDSHDWEALVSHLM